MTSVAVALSVACAARKAAVCHPCFWEYQDAALKAELVEVYGERRIDDPFLDAQRRLLVAIVAEDRSEACAARGAVVALQRQPSLQDPARALLAAEIAAFTAESCGDKPSPAFLAAAARARGASASWKARVYTEVAEGRFRPRFGTTTIARKLDVPPGTASFVLGASKIVVPAGARVGAQVERTVRDWLSYQLSWDEQDAPVAKDALLTWHEGARLRDLLDAAPAKIFPLTGSLAVRRAGSQFVPHR